MFRQFGKGKELFLSLLVLNCFYLKRTCMAKGHNSRTLELKLLGLVGEFRNCLMGNAESVENQICFISSTYTY